MTKTYILEGLDCANCAAKMERLINKIKTVESASVTFMTKKLVVDAAEEGYEETYAAIDKAVHRVDKAVEIKEARR